MTAVPKPDPNILLKNVQFGFGSDEPILKVEEFAVSAAENVFVYGPSGSGKSTLLGIIAGVLVPSGGAVSVMGQDLVGLSAARRDRLRAEHFGVIFQQFNLVPYLDLVENVLLPCRFSYARAKRVAESAKGREERARSMLVQLGLEKELSRGQVASELSTGQQQRVAAARALIGSPSLIIADEPTSALDTETRSIFIETLLSEAEQASVIFVSHDLSLSTHFDREISISTINRQQPNDSSTRIDKVQQLEKF
ncbi:MAG: ABC transporter ATP-binding protein [Pseudomonadota bacterium]